MRRLVLLPLLSVLVGCEIGTRDALPPTFTPVPDASPTVAEAVQSDAQRPPPLPPFELEQLVAAWHEGLKYQVNDEVAVLWTTWKNTRAMWIGSVFIYHIPSESMVVLDEFGAVDERYTRYESEEGQQQLEALLANEALMERIRRYVEILEQAQRAAPSIEAFEAHLETLRFETAAPE